MNSNKEIAKNFLQMITAGDIDNAYDKYIDMSGKHHNIYTPAGFEALRTGMKEAHVKFPNKQFEIQHLLEDSDFVAAHSRLKLETDKPMMAVIHLFRFKNGKIVELWDIGQADTSPSMNTDGAF